MKQLLDAGQLRDFISLLRDLFSHVETVRSSHPFGGYIKRLQVPSVLSESLAAHMLNSGYLGERFRVTPSPSRGDLQVATDTGWSLRLDVKGTTESGFQQLGKKDIAADMLLWIHFSDYLWNADQDNVSVFFLPKPGEVFPNPRRIRLDKFLAIAGDRVLPHSVNIEKLLSDTGPSLGAAPRPRKRWP